MTKSDIRTTSSRSVIGLCIAVLAGLFVTPAAAYIGPGAGLTAIGAFLALVAGVGVALFGFVWLPIRRAMRKKTLGEAGVEADDGVMSDDETA
ncbi:MAG: hypothetical protein AAFR11_11060 [Pseudomonadota bacterium]